jgi:shikimate kinase
MSRLVLVGLRGAGKTAAGRRAAEQLGAAFLDTDQLIEDRGRTIPEIFAEDGEAGFRDIERQVIAALDPPTAAVIASGGGAPLHPDNRAALRALGLVVYLHASPETLAARCEGSDRPRLAGDSALEETRLLLTRREAIYREIAHHAIDTEHLTVDEVARQLTRLAEGGPE